MKFKKNVWFVGIGCSIIASLLYSIGQNYLSIPFLNKILGSSFQIEIKIWHIFLLILILFILRFILNKIFSKSLEFLSFRDDIWRDINWKWEWKINKNKQYEISNLNMLCPNCKDGIFTVASMYSSEYNCVICNHHIPIRNFKKPSHSQIKDEIFNEVRKKYPKEIKYIEHHD